MSSNKSDIIDDIFEEEKKVILFSKLSIFLTCMILSPYWAGFLYCANLRYSNQKSKIFSTYLTISVCYFLTLTPLLGFDVSIYGIDIVLLISKIITGLLVTSALWNKHFGELAHKTIFPWIRLFSMLVVYMAIIVYHTWLYHEFSYYNPPPTYLPSFNSLFTAPIMLLIAFGKTILHFILVLIRKLTN
jgi:hypothetical protein